MARHGGRGLSCGLSVAALPAPPSPCHDGVVRTRTLVPYAAYLRVYEPLAAFTEGERPRLKDYAADAPLPNRHQVLAREQAASLARALATPPVVAPADDSPDAYVLRDGDSLLMCPVQDRLRCWVAINELQASLPDSVVDAILPAAPTSQAEFDYASWQADHPDAVPHILTATWHVPARWFVAFRSSERDLTIEPEQRSVVYRTRMVEARRRVARAARALRQVGGSVLEAVEDLGRWLEAFHPHGWVELDYGGLVYCVGDDELRADDSPGDVAAAVAAVADGDTARAARAYRRVVDRWEPVQAREHAS